METLQLVDLSIYGATDTDFDYDYGMRTLSVGNQEIIRGDEYHDHVKARIAGFLDCLKFLNRSFLVAHQKRVAEPGEF